MNPERWQRIREIFDEVVDLAPGEREEAIERLCADDPSLGSQVRSLISAHEDADEVLGRFEDRPLVPRVAGPTSRSGTRVGPYEIEEELGRGGMGVVYRARDVRLDRSVVLKFLSPELSTDEIAKERFVQEARAASSLDHPHICTVHEIGETEEGQVYIVMSYYEGRTLEERIVDGPADPGQVVDWARQMVRGLSAAHRSGIVHRDVKPGNLMLTDDGLIKILDFGLAKSVGQDLTRSGSTLGTVTYMSPEQARGEAVDRRTDYWSLGAVLYELLAGRPPFRAPYEQSTLYAIVHQEPEPLDRARPGLPAELVQIVHGLLKKDPDARRSDPEALEARLRAIAVGTGGSASDDRTVTAATASRAAGRGPTAAASSAATGPRYRRVPMVAAALAAMFALLWTLELAPFDGMPFRGNDQVSEPDLHAVAVLPFSVRGDEELAYLSEGMVDLLSTKLDGAGRLKSIDPNALLGYLARQPDRVLDPERGREVARHFGAGQFILGRVLHVGDRVQLAATLYDASGAVRTSARVTTPDESALLSAIDGLTQQLIAGQLTGPSERLAGVGVFTTTSVPALKAYLRAEQLVRGGTFREAAELLEEAVEADSTFGLAWYRLATTLGWLDPNRSVEVIEHAVTHSDPLPERARNLVLGYREFLRGEAPAAEARYRDILAEHPDEVAAWQQLGEVLYHYNALYGRPSAEAREPFERALTYDPDNREMIIHLMDLAIHERDYARLDTLLATYSGGEEAETAWRASAYRTTSRLLQSPESVRTLLLDHLELNREEQQWLLHNLVLGRQIHLAAALAYRLLEETTDAEYRQHLHGVLTLLEVARGRWSAAEELLDRAFETADPSDQGTLLMHAVLYRCLPQAPSAPTAANAPTDSAPLRDLRRKVLDWERPELPQLGEKDDLYRDDLPAVRAFLTGVLDLKMGETGPARARLRTLEREADRRGPGTLSFTLHRSLAARLAWTEGDVLGALAALDELQTAGYSPFGRSHAALFDPFYNRYLRAEILQTLGRYEEALRWYDSVTDGTPYGGNLLLGPTFRRRAQIYEQLGRDEEATDAWRSYVELWTQSDPHLRARVDSARRRLAALTGGADALAAASGLDASEPPPPAADAPEAHIDSAAIDALIGLARTGLERVDGDSLLEAALSAANRELETLDLEEIVARALRDAEIEREASRRESDAQKSSETSEQVTPRQ